ncbi:amidohydrolase family protein [Muricoccus radiodurans]|uniref:amidohydrolase family protein n=1 Tax=Muricoccus radiodurans TaxID=2231721 RepID=UPI003CE877AD
MTAGTILGVPQSAPDFAVPPGACDCHVHVFGPASRYPWSPDRTYTPGEAGVDDLLDLQRGLRLDRVVIVHPGPYGTDNRRTLDALRQLGPRRARGVCVIAPSTEAATLRAMHSDGIRGARVNLELKGRQDPGLAADLLRRTADTVGPLGWHLQAYTRLSVLDALHDVIQALPIPFVVDHFGRAAASGGPDQPGFAALLSLLRGGRAYVKLSAANRISSHPETADAAPIARALIAANPDRVLWGTDWPHTGGAGRDGDPAATIEPFVPVDDGAALNRLAAWAGDPALTRRILVDNPARLYGF